MLAYFRGSSEDWVDVVSSLLARLASLPTEVFSAGERCVDRQMRHKGTTQLHQTRAGSEKTSTVHMRLLSLLGHALC